MLPVILLDVPRHHCIIVYTLHMYVCATIHALVHMHHYLYTLNFFVLPSCHENSNYVLDLDLIPFMRSALPSIGSGEIDAKLWIINACVCQIAKTLRLPSTCFKPCLMLMCNMWQNTCTNPTGNNMQCLQQC